MCPCHTGAVYICTEDVFPSKRLRQLTEFFVQDHSKLKLTAKNVSDNIFVEHTATIVSNVRSISVVRCVDSKAYGAQLNIHCTMYKAANMEKHNIVCIHFTLTRQTLILYVCIGF